MDFDFDKIAKMSPEDQFDAAGRMLNQIAAFHGDFIAALVKSDDRAAVIAEAGARRGLATFPDLIERRGHDEALRMAAGRFGDSIWDALEEVSSRARGIFRAAQDMAGETPVPPLTPHTPGVRDFADRLRYFADLFERRGGYWEAAEAAADDLKLEQEFEGIEGPLLDHFVAQKKADYAGLALLMTCIESVLEVRG